MQNEDTIVYSVWLIAAVLSLLLIGLAIARGYSKKSQLTLVDWRGIKLVATLFGCVSLFLFVLSFDQLVRGSSQSESEAYLDDRFYELKLITADEKATACSRSDEDSKNLCTAWKNIDAGFQIDYLREGKELSQISDWQAFCLRQDEQKRCSFPEKQDEQKRCLIPEKRREQVDRLVCQINRTVPRAAARLILRPEARLSIALVATLTLIFSIAGSVGEAAYQLRQAEDAASKLQGDEGTAKTSIDPPAPQSAATAEPGQQPVSDPARRTAVAGDDAPKHLPESG
jgi:hypothetical protein